MPPTREVAEVAEVANLDDQRRAGAYLRVLRRHRNDTEPPYAAVLAAAALEEAALEDPALTRHFAEVVARAPKMTAEQAAYLRRLFRYLPAGVTQ